MKLIVCAEIEVDVDKKQLPAIKQISESAAYAAHRVFRDRDIPVLKFRSRTKQQKSRAIPVTREELKNILASLELVGGNSWQDLERTRENCGVLVNTLLRRRQKELT